MRSPSIELAGVSATACTKTWSPGTRASLLAIAGIALGLGLLAYVAERSASHTMLLPRFAALGGDPHYANYWLPALEQGARRYLPDRNAAATCFSPGWNTRAWLGFEALFFKMIDGPPCGAGEACPDFSANGLPIRLGLAYNVELREVTPNASPLPHFEQGLDNFKATVWRH